MEIDFSSRSNGDAGAPVTAAEARAALEGLHADGAALAERIVTPIWYHPILGTIAAGLVAGTSLPGSASTIVVAVGVVALALLMLVYRQRYGIVISRPTGPRSRRLLGAAIAALVVGMASSVVIKLGELSSWWMLLPALLVGALTVVLGARYDDALRDELAGTRRPRA